MSGTNQKILRAARLLFNEHGVAKVSQRTICDHIAISPGNLTYHFKKRDDIIEALYFELATAIEECLDVAEKAELNLAELAQLTKATNKIFFENRFFVIDFIQILRSNAVINKHYTNISTRRFTYIKQLVENLIQTGEMRKAELPNEYNNLYKRSELFGDFWVASIGSTPDEVMLKHTRIYTDSFMQSFYPYLTRKGKDAFLILKE
ncbi:MAG: TetR family transcriptional regulator [Crocinitomix sp.]|nr:TetR family transcriptional regulator [Crocinitomix sp.]